MKDELKLLGRSEGVVSGVGQSLTSTSKSCLLYARQMPLMNHDRFPSELKGSLRTLLDIVLWAAAPELENWNENYLHP